MSLMIDETRLSFHRIAAEKFCSLDALMFNGQTVKKTGKQFSILQLESTSYSFFFKQL